MAAEPLAPMLAAILLSYSGLPTKQRFGFRWYGHGRPKAFSCGGVGGG